MNNRQKEILQSELNNEKKTIKELEQVYTQAIKDCEKKIRELSMRSDMENLQSIVYQKQYQQAIKGQLEGVLEQLHSNEFATVSEYLNKCYTYGFVGNMYDLAGQGIPLIIPINQNQVAKAIQIDSKLSKTLYESLGEDVKKLKTAVRAQVSRGIANGSSWNEIAKTLAERNMKNSPFGTAINNSIRIARTEGHRVQTAAKMDAMTEAKKKGADVVKQWDASLDGRTRDTHRKLDGQIRELDEPFEVDGMKADAPGYFGDPAEDCNCRCAVLQRAKWALDESELETLQQRAEYFGLDKTEDFEDFKDKYLQASQQESDNVQKSDESTSQEKAEDKVDIDAINKQISDNNEKIEELSQQVNDVNSKLEKEMLFGNDASKAESLRNQYETLKNEVNKLTEENKKLNALLPKAELETSKAIVIEGKNLIGQVDYKNSKFDYDIETAMNAQGFDGVPNVVPYEEFSKAMKESGFYAERTYSAQSQELLDEYRNQLYNGKWYVDCSEGGAQYGQGMYCAACYDLNNNKSMGGIGFEMSHYQQIGLSKGNGFHYTEAITLQPSAKIFNMVNDSTDIVNRYSLEYTFKNAESEEAKKLVKSVIDIQEKIDYYSCSSLCGKVDWDKVDSLYEERNKILNSKEWMYDYNLYGLRGEAYRKINGINPGALAAEMGYDAINAIGHGESGSYTVILNRTKVIFCEGGSIYGN